MQHPAAIAPIGRTCLANGGLHRRRRRHCANGWRSMASLRLAGWPKTLRGPENSSSLRSSVWTSASICVTGEGLALCDEHGEQVERLVHANIEQVAGYSRSLPMTSHLAESRVEGFGRSHQQHVAFTDEPKRTVGEDRQKRRHDRPKVIVADVVGMRPLAQATLPVPDCPAPTQRIRA